MICGVCAFEGNLCLSAFSSSSFFFFASWQLQSLLKFLYHGQYLGFFEKFRKEEGEERARESFIIVEHRREKN